MKDIPSVFPTIDLLWAEGAAYNVGFANALATWAKAIRPNGFAVVSELCWLREHKIPDAITEFFRSGYPEMQSVEQNIETAEEAGYKLFNTYTLPKETWVKDYYDILEPRAKSLLNHSDVAVRNSLSKLSKKSKPSKLQKTATDTSSTSSNDQTEIELKSLRKSGKQEAFYWISCVPERPL